MRNKTLLAGLLCAAACLGVASAGAEPQPAAKAAKPGGQCFMMSEWQGWRPSSDAKSLYMRVGVRQVWRADFDSACTPLNEPDAHLVTHVWGGSVCNGLDLDLKVADSTGFSMPCIVKSLTRLSADEVKALPKDARP